MSWPSALSRLRTSLPDLVAFRRDLHRHPELGFAEHRTQGAVRERLTELGYDARPCARTGLVADLNPGAGPTIALRADLDALPMHELTDLPYRSTHDGVAHKCGHDGHTSILLGVATALTELRGAIDGNVRLLFQPAEEGVDGGGAKVMVEEGALEGVREVYGLHNWPGFPKGSLRVAAGPVMADVHHFAIHLVGRGGHGSEPQRCRDPIVAGASVVTALQSVVPRNTGYHGGAVVTVGAFQAGEAGNVIPGEAVLRGTIRSFDDELRDRVIATIREVSTGAAAAHRVEAKVELETGYPVLINDADCAAAVARAASNAFDDVSGDGLPLAASEDFAFFTRAVPGAYFFVGAGVAGESTPGCHHPDFDFDDDLLGPAATCFVEIVRDRLGGD